MHLIQLYQFTIDKSGNINTDAPGVPLIYVDADGKTEEEIASAKGRNTVGVVFAQIEADLLKAVENLESGYERPSVKPAMGKGCCCCCQGPCKLYNHGFKFFWII